MPEVPKKDEAVEPLTDAIITKYNMAGQIANDVLKVCFILIFTALTTHFCYRNSWVWPRKVLKLEIFVLTVILA